MSEAAETDGVFVNGVNLRAGCVVDEQGEKFPSLIFTFTDSTAPIDQRELPPIVFVAEPALMRKMAKLVRAASFTAIKKASP